MKTKKIAITGNIGSGKSLICKIFNHLGINTFHSDEETKKLYLLPDVKKEIIDHFGEEVYFADGSLNKKLLSYHLFQNESALKFIESLLYPKLNQVFDEWCEKQTSDFVLFESAILFEKNGSGIILENNILQGTSREIAIEGDAQVQYNNNSGVAEYNKKSVSEPL